MEFVANTVPAILVLGGILLAILGNTLFGGFCIVLGVCVYLIKGKSIKW